MLVKKAAALLAAATIGGILIGTTPALASSGGCISGDACLYYSPDRGGAKFGKSETGNYDGAYFGGGGAGDGQAVINNAASVENLSNWWNLRVYYGPDLSGPNQYVPKSTWVNLGPVPWNGGSVDMRNNNHSQGWYV